MVIATVLVVGACTDAGGQAPVSEHLRAVTSTGRCLFREGQRAAEFVGLTEQAAQRLAEARSLLYRVQGRDDRCLGGTDDLRPNRVNVVVVRGRVTDARRY